MQVRWRRCRGSDASGQRVGRRPGLSCILAVATALVLAACESPAEPNIIRGYDFTLPVSGDIVYRWPEGSTVRLYADPSGDPERAALLEEAVDYAIGDWSDALGDASVSLVRVEELRAADVVVRWSDVPPPVQADHCAPRVSGSAATTFCPNADLTGLERFPLPDATDPDESSVRMLVTVLAEEAVGLGRVRQLVAHELGHVLGIGRHSPDPNDLMWDGPLGTDRPSAADRATIRRLYDTPPMLVP